MAYEYDAIAKELTLALIERGTINPSEWPNAKTTADVIGQTYQRIYGYVSWNPESNDED